MPARAQAEWEGGCAVSAKWVFCVGRWRVGMTIRLRIFLSAERAFFYRPQPRAYEKQETGVLFSAEKNQKRPCGARNRALAA